MVSTDSLIQASSDISDAFFEKKYFTTIHSLETGDEGMYSLFVVELKYPLPPSAEVQFALLWKSIEEYEFSEDYYEKMSSREKQDSLFSCFTEFLNGCDFRVTTDSDTERTNEIINECQSLVLENPEKMAWGKDHKVGYYKNGKFVSSRLPKELINKVSLPGTVATDDWNDYMVIFESKRALSLFYWFTGA
ncbi:hypothetical protein [Spartinivicinus ruber]|uniref:hypothetical protein n=1 Tax=Spartinivicinus ruber TaxID=2683272 RepID=UPI0013CF7ACB|nr:hypothetical protein [Spartinivicinus ruber]